MEPLMNAPLYIKPKILFHILSENEAHEVAHALVKMGFRATVTLGGHPKPAIGGHFKTGQR